MRVPLNLHPQIAPKEVRDSDFEGFGKDIGIAPATGAWGWHADAGLAALRLILAGVFDRHPDLQLILGPWGEMLVPFIERANELSPLASHLDRPIADYVQQNFFATPSGILSQRMLDDAVAVMGAADRIMMSTDYPFQFAA